MKPYIETTLPYPSGGPKPSKGQILGQDNSSLAVKGIKQLFKSKSNNCSMLLQAMLSNASDAVENSENLFLFVLFSQTAIILLRYVS